MKNILATLAYCLLVPGVALAQTVTPPSPAPTPITLPSDELIGSLAIQRVAATPDSGAHVGVNATFAYGHNIGDFEAGVAARMVRFGADGSAGLGPFMEYSAYSFGKSLENKVIVGGDILGLLQGNDPAKATGTFRFGLKHYTAKGIAVRATVDIQRAVALTGQAAPDQLNQVAGIVGFSIPVKVPPIFPAP